MNVQRAVKKLRILKAKMSGVTIGEWDVADPSCIDGKLYAWKLTEDGRYEYRPMTDTEILHYSEWTAW